MATVKFSSDLRDKIVNIAGQKFQGAVSVAANSAPKDWGDRLYDYAFASYVEDMAKFPDGFFAKRDNICVHSIDMGKQDDIGVNLTFKFSSNKMFPAAYPKKFPWRLRGSYSEDIVIRYSAVLDDFITEVVAYKKRVKGATERQAEFKASVKAVVDAYATLAPALKAWPPLWDLIPEDTKTKHKTIVEREVKERDVGIDLARATALASFTKIRSNDNQ